MSERGGSDFFGATTIARKDGDHYVLNGQKRLVVGAEGARPQEALPKSIVRAFFDIGIWAGSV